MNAWSVMEDYSELHLFQDQSINFFAAICLHTQGRGPAIGGCRFIEYASQDAAIQDAVRLSKAMRSKSAISELPHDGGKAVIMLPKGNFDREIFLKKFAECVDSLHGKYITTIDSGTTQADMSIIKKYTSHVVGYLTGSMADSNPSDSTALGVYEGIKAAVKLKYGIDHLNGLHVAIQGAGSVGYRLAKLLHQAGVNLTISDVNNDLAQRVSIEFGATVVLPQDIYRVKCDVFSPCALGRIINHDTVKLLQTKIIAGAANDQLATDDMPLVLNQMDILYLPDYLLNAGGLIHLALELQGKSSSYIENTVSKIGSRVLELAAIAMEKGISLLEVVQEKVRA